jgi:hypothetical protein
MARAVADLIDSGSLSRWLADLWPVACQTCGEPLGSKADISVDGPIDNTKVLVSMHHCSCRPSGITSPRWAGHYEPAHLLLRRCMFLRPRGKPSCALVV